MSSEFEQGNASPTTDEDYIGRLNTADGISVTDHPISFDAGVTNKDYSNGPSWFEKYKWYIIGGGVGLILLVLLLIILFRRK